MGDNRCLKEALAAAADDVADDVAAADFNASASSASRASSRLRIASTPNITSCIALCFASVFVRGGVGCCSRCSTGAQPRARRRL